MTARKHVLWFLTITFALSWLLMAHVVNIGGIHKAGPLIVLVMWIPGLVSLIYRGVTRLSYRDVGWRLGPWKYPAYAFLVPFFVAAIAYAIAWSTGVSEFAMPTQENLLPLASTSLSEIFLKRYPIAFVVGFVAAFGEELGWRGFLIPKLYDTGWKHPLFISAFIWGVWHYPLILWGGYATSDSPIISLVLFTIMIGFSGVFVGWLRMRSGSVWVATLYHAAHNMFLQTAFELFNRPGPRAQYLAGESGVIPCVVYSVVLWIGYRLIRRNERFA